VNQCKKKIIKTIKSEVKSMKSFKINENITIEARSEKTSYGFRHLATLIYNEREIKTVKTCYYNRTWERFEFESVIHKLAENCKCLSYAEKDLIMNFDNTEEEKQPLKILSAFMQLNDLIHDKPEDLKLKNDSKLRMLKAQFKDGLILPEDWNE
jgi:hypothetical protein